ncbi:peroxiredoxin type-2, partial [Spiromyces aspiralis]
ESHLPGYLTYYTQLVDKGVQKIICVSTNDAFVMHAWGRENKVSDKIVMVSDFDYKLGQALGLMNDNNRRLKRFAVVIDNLKVTHLGVEPARGVTVSGAEYLLSKL